MNPLHAPYYADEVVSMTVRVACSEQIAADTMRLRVHAPEIAERIVPGQFLMVRLAGFDDPLIGRAFALYRVPSPDELEVVYVVKGKLTTRLAKVSVGDELLLWGPLGNGFGTQPCDHLIMAAGGIGQTPFLALGGEAVGRIAFPNRSSGYASKVTLLYGVRTAKLIAGETDFREMGIDVDLCTDDGSRGTRARVPDRLRAILAAIPTGQRVRVVSCGPEIMMKRVADVCRSSCVDCEVSLETPMACGIGICFSCVAKIKQVEGGWDYKRTCVEGPIFDAEKVVW